MQRRYAPPPRARQTLLQGDLRLLPYLLFDLAPCLSKLGHDDRESEIDEDEGTEEDEEDKEEDCDDVPAICIHDEVHLIGPPLQCDCHEDVEDGGGDGIIIQDAVVRICWIHSAKVRAAVAPHRAISTPTPTATSHSCRHSSFYSSLICCPRRRRACAPPATEPSIKQVTGHRRPVHQSITPLPERALPQLCPSDGEDDEHESGDDDRVPQERERVH